MLRAKIVYPVESIVGAEREVARQGHCGRKSPSSDISRTGSGGQYVMGSTYTVFDKDQEALTEIMRQNRERMSGC